MNYGRNGGVNAEHGGLLVLEKYKSSHSEKLVIFDIGAHTGEFSILCSEILGDEKISVHAFEPSRVAFESLESNTRSMNFICRYNIGMGQKRSAKWLKNSGSKIATIEDSQFNGAEAVQMESLDAFCSEHKINFIDYLKMDVEGYEFEVLKGARNLIQTGKIEFIQFEFGYFTALQKPGLHFHSYIDLLKEKYDLFRILEDGVVPIAAGADSEIYNGANFLAQLRRTQ
jgi:FkbM family methyltransferase